MNTLKNSVPNAVYGLFAYVFLLLPSLLFAALIWERWVVGNLYICTDVDFDILDIFPPFVHQGTRDAYLVPAWEVWLVWSSLMLGVLALPAPLIWYVWRREVDYDA